jgi:hypothetical protein
VPVPLTAALLAAAATLLGTLSCLANEAVSPPVLTKVAETPNRSCTQALSAGTGSLTGAAAGVAMGVRTGVRMGVAAGVMIGRSPGRGGAASAGVASRLPSRTVVVNSIQPVRCVRIMSLLLMNE